MLLRCTVYSLGSLNLYTLIVIGDASKVGILKSLPHADSRLLLFQADIYDPVGFDPAIRGCDFVFHVATPMRHNTESSLVSLSLIINEFSWKVLFFFFK